MKRIFILFLALNYTLMSVVLAVDVNESGICKINQREGSIQRLCNNVDDIICKDVPPKLRRSCNEAEHSIIHENMSPDEVYGFTKSCLTSAGISFIEFFTHFLPDLCREIWSLIKEGYNLVIDGQVLTSIKGKIESSQSVAVDIYEVIKENPAGFLKNFWMRLIEAIGPMIANFDCLNPEAKVGKVCGTLTEWIMPPAILAKILIKGPKAAKEIYEMKLRRSKTSDASLVSVKEFPDKAIVLEKYTNCHTIMVMELY